jgi:hypothetical protein
MSRSLYLVLATSLLAAAHTHADVRGTVRFGMLPLELEASRDTALFGDEIADAVDGYNRAADAYDRRFGGVTPRADLGDVGLEDTLVLIAPGFEAGGDIAFFRLEGQVGFGDTVRSYGLGIYPLNLQLALSPELVAYVSAGGTASWLERRDSDLGALVSARAAGGVRISRRVLVEAGYAIYAIGGVVDRDVMDDYQPSPGAPPPSPREVVAAGEGSGMVDVSVGVVF